MTDQPAGPPPGIQIMGMPFGPPTPEQLAFQQAEAAEVWAARQRVIKWGAILCTCRLSPRWTFDAEPTPPQVNCIVHQAFMMSPDGTMLA